jgi:hypothetical protein
MTSHGRPEPRRRSVFGRRERKVPAPRHDLLQLVSSGRLIDVYDTLDNPSTAVIAAEDACWQFARADWESRKPHRWQYSAYRAWREEGQRIDAKRQRLVEFANDIRTVGRAG